MWNRRKVDYYAILLLLILGGLLGERNYIIIIFPEYDTRLERNWRKWKEGQARGQKTMEIIKEKDKEEKFEVKEIEIQE